MKICVNCIHYQLPAQDGSSADYRELGKCARQMITSPVTGNKLYTQIAPCSYQRKSDASNNCGPEARFFEPRQPQP